MNKWERGVYEHLTSSEYRFLSDYDRWLRTAFANIPIGGGEHVIHTFHLAVGWRLSSVLAKHSVASFTLGQAAADTDVKALRSGRKLADLPRIGFNLGADFTPQDAIKVLQNRAIALAGDVESDITSSVKSVLLQHLTGELTRRQAQEQIADLLKTNMDRASLIVTTETTYAYNQGRLMQYRAGGVDYVCYSAVMDGRTCPICASRDGKIAPIGAMGGDVPPVHGRCRCVLSPVFSTLQPELLTPEALNWSKVTPLAKSWVPEDAPRASGKVFSTETSKSGKMETTGIVDRRTGKPVRLTYERATLKDATHTKDWEFKNWTKPFHQGFDVYKATIPGDKTLQGLIALKNIPADKAYYVELFESNPKNVGSKKGDLGGVGGYLLAIAAKMSFEAGYDGYVYLEAKTGLVDYYGKVYGAKRISSQRMYLDSEAADALVQRYFGGGKNG